MSSLFATPDAPGSGDRFVPVDEEGRLLLIDVLSLEREVLTPGIGSGSTDAIRANVHILDGPNPRTLDDTLLFGTVIRSQLSKQIGARVLGRLAKGEKKPGKNPPWILAAATLEDTAVAEGWVRANEPAPVLQSAAPPF